MIFTNFRNNIISKKRKEKNIINILFRQFSNLFSQIGLQKWHTSLFSGICREIRTKFHQKFAEKIAKFDAEKEELGNALFIREKMLTILAEILRLKNGAKECIV